MQRQAVDGIQLKTYSFSTHVGQVDFDPFDRPILQLKNGRRYEIVLTPFQNAENLGKLTKRQWGELAQKVDSILTEQGMWSKDKPVLDDDFDGLIINRQGIQHRGQIAHVNRSKALTEEMLDTLNRTLTGAVPPPPPPNSDVNAAKAKKSATPNGAAVKPGATSAGAAVNAATAKPAIRRQALDRPAANTEAVGLTVAGRKAVTDLVSAEVRKADKSSDPTQLFSTLQTLDSEAFLDGVLPKALAKAKAIDRQLTGQDIREVAQGRVRFEAGQIFNRAVPRSAAGMKDRDVKSYRNMISGLADPQLQRSLTQQLESARQPDADAAAEAAPASSGSWFSW